MTPWAELWRIYLFFWDMHNSKIFYHRNCDYNFFSSSKPCKTRKVMGPFDIVVDNKGPGVKKVKNHCGKQHGNTQWTVGCCIEHVVCLFLSKWVVLGQNKLQSGPDFMPTVKNWLFYNCTLDKTTLSQVLAMHI